MLATHLGFYNVASSRTHVRFQFSTHAAAGGNVAPNSAFEAADLRIYKAADGAAFSATQRTSANGITMTSPFDSLTGFHDVDIDLADNTDAGFYAAGSMYAVVLAPDETVDGQTLTGVVLAYFEIGRPQADVREFGGSAGTFAGGRPEVNTTHFNGTGATAAGGRPEVNTTHLAGVQQSLTDLKHFADSGYDPATSKVEGVKLADTLTTYTGNTPQTGDSFARLGAPAGASHAVDVAAVKAQTAAIETDTQDIQTKVGTPAGASVSVDIAAVKADTGAIKPKTDALPASPAAVGSAMTLTAGERDSIAAALLDLADSVETGITVRKALRALAATMAGDVAGGPGSPVHKSIGGATDRVSSTADADGNRTVVLNL